jgi:hypothetical protein
MYLSTKSQRQEYDEARRRHGSPPRFDYSPSDAEAQFRNIFEETFRQNPGAADIPQQPGPQARWNNLGEGLGFLGPYAVLGSASGAALGFITANIPGAVVGFFVGNRLGAIRDKHGKSVYEVFRGLDPEMRSIILAQLAARILAQSSNM